jgi:nucleotide-binding universal stress UspA family protein
MYEHILIATDGSELAGKAVAQGLALAKALKAEVTAVTVTEPWDALSSFDDYESRMAKYAEDTLSAVSRAAREEEVPCATLHVKDRRPAEGIVEAARTQGCDLIVVASHGRRGLARLLLGSQAYEVVTTSPVPVLVCR